MMRRIGSGLLILLMWGALFPLWAAEYHYSYLPKRVYTTQVFPVTVLASHANPAQKVTFAFDSTSPTQPISIMPVSAQNGDDLFYTFYFQATDDDTVHLPALSIHEGNRTQTLPRQAIPAQKLDSNARADFCGLIAADCKLLSSQISLFDANTTLVSITFQAHGANPEAIHIPHAIEEGLESIDRTQAKATVEYYFVIPSKRKKITLSYYNTIQRRFISTTIATDYRNRPVAAQVELNPRVSPFDRLKKYGSIALILFLVVMLWWQREWLYLILLHIMILVMYFVYQPRAMLCIREGSPLYILPTHNSRTSTTLSEQWNTRSLDERGTYYKIKYHNGIIGWIRHEDLCQN